MGIGAARLAADAAPGLRHRLQAASGVGGTPLLHARIGPYGDSSIARAGIKQEHACSPAANGLWELALLCGPRPPARERRTCSSPMQSLNAPARIMARDSQLCRCFLQFRRTNAKVARRRHNQIFQNLSTIKESKLGAGIAKAIHDLKVRKNRNCLCNEMLAVNLSLFHCQARFGVRGFIALIHTGSAFIIAAPPPQAVGDLRQEPKVQQPKTTTE